MDRRWDCGLPTGVPPSFCLSRCFTEAQGTSLGDERIYLSVTELAERMKWIWLETGWAGLEKHLNISARLESESRYTEHDRLACNRCPKQSCNTECRQQARCYRHRDLCKSRQCAMHWLKPNGFVSYSNLAFSNSIFQQSFPHIYWIFMQEDVCLPWKIYSFSKNNPIDLLYSYI